MANLSGLAAIVGELREERTNLLTQLKQIDSALLALDGSNGKQASFATIAPAKRTVSTAARKKMSLAQKARWASGNTNSSVTKTKTIPRRTMSASARRKIAMAQRARWAKVKAAAKKAA